jgi:hypothetical protein
MEEPSPPGDIQAANAHHGNWETDGVGTVTANQQVQRGKIKSNP